MSTSNILINHKIIMKLTTGMDSMSARTNLEEDWTEAKHYTLSTLLRFLKYFQNYLWNYDISNTSHSRSNSLKVFLANIAEK